MDCFFLQKRSVKWDLDDFIISQDILKDLCTICIKIAFYSLLVKAREKPRGVPLNDIKTDYIDILFKYAHGFKIADIMLLKEA